jgi:hypothetical protein
MAPQTLSEMGEDATEPYVAMNNSGNAVAVWSRLSGAYSLIQARFYNHSTRMWGAIVTISPSDMFSVFPRVYINSSGDAIIVWSGHHIGEEDIAQASVYSSTSETWSTAFLLSSSDTSVEYVCAVLNDRGKAYVLWTAFSPEVRLQAATYDEGWQTAVDISPAGEFVANARIGIDADGNGFAVWKARTLTDGYQFKVASDTGTGWGTPSIVLGDASYTLDPDCVTSRDGHAIMVWGRRDGDHRASTIYSMERLRGVWGSPVSIATTGGISRVSVVCNNLDNAVALWINEDTHQLEGAAYTSGSWSPLSQNPPHMICPEGRSMAINDVPTIVTLFERCEQPYSHSIIAASTGTEQ